MTCNISDIFEDSIEEVVFEGVNISTVTDGSCSCTPCEPVLPDTETIEEYMFDEENLFPPHLIRGNLLATPGRTTTTGQWQLALFGGGVVFDVDPNLLPSPTTADIGKILTVTGAGTYAPMAVGNTIQQLQALAQTVDFEVVSAIPRNYMITSIILRNKTAYSVIVKIGTSLGSDDLGFVSVDPDTADDSILTLNKSFNANFKTLYFSSDSWNNAEIDVSINYLRYF